MQSVFHHRGVATELTSGQWLQVMQSSGFLAVVFDCDGTLVESSDAHFRCMQVAARDQGYAMSREWYRARTGLDRRALFDEFQTVSAGQFDIDRACDVSVSHYGSVLDLIKPIQAVVDCAVALHSRNVRMAVATNAELQIAKQSLGAIGLLHVFDTVVSASDVARPKPSPDVFNLALHRLGHAAQDSLIVEDSPQGVAAAKATGASVLALVPGS